MTCVEHQPTLHRKFYTEKVITKRLTFGPLVSFSTLSYVDNYPSNAKIGKIPSTRSRRSIKIWTTMRLENILTPRISKT